MFLYHLNNKFVIIKNNNKYKIYKYEIHNGFHYLLNDKETLIFENTNLIYGKVLSLIRKT